MLIYTTFLVAFLLTRKQKGKIHVKNRSGLIYAKLYDITYSQQLFKDV